MRKSNQMKDKKEYWKEHWSGHMANRYVKDEKNDTVEVETIFRYGKATTLIYSIKEYDDWVNDLDKVYDTLCQM